MGSGHSRAQQTLAALICAEDALIQRVRADNDPVFQEVKLLTLVPAIYDAYDGRNEGWLQLEQLHALLSDYLTVLGTEIPKLWRKGLFAKADMVLKRLDKEAPADAPYVRRQWETDREDMLESLAAFLASKRALLDRDPLWARTVGPDEDDVERLVAAEHRHHLRNPEMRSAPTSPYGGLSSASSSNAAGQGRAGPLSPRTLGTASVTNSSGGAGLSSFAFATSPAGASFRSSGGHGSAFTFGLAPAGSGASASSGSLSGFHAASSAPGHSGAASAQPLPPPAAPPQAESAWAAAPGSSQGERLGSAGGVGLAGSGVGSMPMYRTGSAGVPPGSAAVAGGGYAPPQLARLLNANVKMSPAMRAMMEKQQAQAQAQREAAARVNAGAAAGGMRLGGRLFQEGELFTAEAVDPRDGLLHRTLVHFKSYEKTSGLPATLYSQQVEQWRCVPKDVFLHAFRDVLASNDLNYTRISRTLFVRTQTGPVLRAYATSVLRRTPEAAREEERKKLALSLGLAPEDEAAAAAALGSAPHSSNATGSGKAPRQHAGASFHDEDLAVVVIGGENGGHSGHNNSSNNSGDVGHGGNNNMRSGIDDDEELDGILNSVRMGSPDWAGADASDASGDADNADGAENADEDIHPQTAARGAADSNGDDDDDDDDDDDEEEEEKAVAVAAAPVSRSDDDDDDDDDDDAKPAVNAASAGAGAVRTKTGDSPFPVRFRSESDSDRDEANAANSNDDDDDAEEAEAGKGAAERGDDVSARSVSEAIENAGDSDDDDAPGAVAVTGVDANANDDDDDDDGEDEDKPAAAAVAHPAADADADADADEEPDDDE